MTKWDLCCILLAYYNRQCLWQLELCIMDTEIIFSDYISDSPCNDIRDTSTFPELKAQVLFLSLILIFFFWAV